MGAAATLNPTTLAVEPGAEVTAEIKVRNTGHVVDQFALDVVGEPAAWSTVDPPTLSLLPGTEGVATVRFRPPRASEVRAGSFPFGVRVRPKEDPDGAVTEEGTLDIGAFKDLLGELIPHTSHGRTQARHDLAVDNRGNLGLNADLEGSDPNGALRFRFSPASLVTDPNTATFAKVMVRPAKRFWKGPPRSHPFKVDIKPRSAPPVTVDGVMLQEAILPPWILKALVALVALLALLAIAWVALVRPAIKSAAKDAVAAPLASQSAAVAAVKAQGAQNAASLAKLGVTPSVVPSPVESTGAAGALGDPFHQRLPLSQTFPSGSSRTDNYTVPGNGTLSVADIVLENPQGDSGTMSIQIVDGSNTSTLLVENLDNFRDLDYHFVSPPVLTANQKLQIQVQCPANNGANATPPSPGRACTPSALFSGFLKKSS